MTRLPKATVDEELAEWVATHADEAGISQAAVMRRAMSDYRARHESSSNEGGPESRELREAWRHLKTYRNPDSKRAELERAVSGLAERMSTPSAAVRPAFLQPLLNRGYISVIWGQLYVYDAPRDDSPDREPDAALYRSEGGDGDRARIETDGGEIQ